MTASGRSKTVERSASPFRRWVLVDIVLLLVLFDEGRSEQGKVCSKPDKVWKETKVLLKSVSIAVRDDCAADDRVPAHICARGGRYAHGLSLGGR